MRYLALGDSYTVGEGVPASDRWPERLAALLRAQGLSVDAPVVVARTGWTTDELQAALAAAPPTGPFDLVSLLIGVNDQFRGRDPGEYARGFGTLLDGAAALAGGHPSRVVVLSIPDWGVTPFARGRDRARIAREIDDFNASSRRLATLVGARYVDVTPSSRLAASDPALLAPDGLHPSGRLYEQWARLALPQAEAALAVE